jgi:hypothetical protein
MKYKNKSFKQKFKNKSKKNTRKNRGGVISNQDYCKTPINNCNSLKIKSTDDCNYYYQKNSNIACRNPATNRLSTIRNEKFCRQETRKQDYKICPYDSLANDVYKKIFINLINIFNEKISDVNMSLSEIHIEIHNNDIKKLNITKKDHQKFIQIQKQIKKYNTYILQNSTLFLSDPGVANVDHPVHKFLLNNSEEYKNNFIKYIHGSWFNPNKNIASKILYEFEDYFQDLKDEEREKKKREKQTSRTQQTPKQTSKTQQTPRKILPQDIIKALKIIDLNLDDITEADQKEVVKRKCRDLKVKNHPDKNKKEDKDIYDELFKKIADNCDKLKEYYGYQ